MALSDEQLSYRSLVMGSSTTYDLIKVTGIGDLNVRRSDRDFPRGHGQIPARHYARANPINIDVEVVGTAGSTALEDDVADLLKAFSPDSYEGPDDTNDQFNYKWGGEDEKFFYARPTRRRVMRDRRAMLGLVRVQIQLTQYDPRRYGTTLNTSGSQTTTFSVSNDGDARAYPIITFNPDANGDAKLTNDTTGVAVEFDNAGAAPGLVMDFDRFIRGRSNLLIAYRTTIDKYSDWVQPRPVLYLAEGNNDFTLNTGDNVIVQWYDTWM
jgi:hypothetical protein